MQSHTYRTPRVETIAASGQCNEEIQSPISQVPPETPCALWTPSCWRGYSDDDSSDEKQGEESKEGVDVVRVFNDAMKQLSDVTTQETPAPLTFQLKKDWDAASKGEKKECIEVASEACRLICKIIAPDAGEQLYTSLPFESAQVSQELKALMTAYASAPTRNLKTQILSIYAYEYSAKKLQELHEPYAKITQWQIKRARAHAKKNGPGVEVTKVKHHRINLDMSKVDHFVDFVNRPYFHQDVAFGMRKLKLENGEVIEMPNVIRTVTRSTMINQYKQFCDESAFEPLSRSTLYRILEVREASERKSLQGLDNTAADGASAFESMKTIVRQLVNFGVEKSWSDNTEKRLDQGKQYLKTDYRVHCKEEFSLCADHCRQFALSDPNDVDFKVSCNHTHAVVCDSCEDIKEVIDEIKTKLQEQCKITKELRDDLLYDFNEAKNNIDMWKAHILRSANQELAKQHTLRDMDNSSILLVMDWAMKFVQLRYREKQSQWFGKRGLSWHISSVVSKSSDSQELSVTSYAHLFDACSQDWFAVTSIVEDLLIHIKSKSPNIKNVYLRSDEAGCYHNNLLIAAIKDIGDRAGIQIKRYDFSEPQQGKDICDRIICPLKSAVRTHCNEGNDVLNALQMQTALLQHPVKGTMSSVNKVNESVTPLETTKVKQFSAYHNFQYEKSGITVWKAYGIGKGKKLTNEMIYVTHQQSTSIQVIQGFQGVDSTGRTLKRKEDACGLPDVKDDCLFECTEQGCNYSCKTFDQLELHLDVGEHSRFVNNESVYDVIRKEWSKKFKTIDVNTSEESKQGSVRSKTGVTHLNEGWALSKAKTGSKRFSTNVREYLVQKFEVGEKTGNKADPTAVAQEMRNVKKEDGQRRFNREEWLNQSQIKSFFSRLAKLKRSNCSKQISCEEIPLKNPDSDSETDDEEDYRDEIVKNILSTISTTHPVVYENYDLCDIAKNEKLYTFKVTKLKEMCAHFEIPFKSKDKKSDLIIKLSDMISKCTCH